MRPKRLRTDITPAQDTFDEDTFPWTSVDDDVYEFNANEFFTSLMCQRFRRPLPAIVNLLSLAPQRRHDEKNRDSSTSIFEEDTGDSQQDLDPSIVSGNPMKTHIPFLNDFFRQVNEKNSILTNPNTGTEEERNEEKLKHSIAKIDSVSNLLNQRQHKRLIQILSDFERCGDSSKIDSAHRAEYKKLGSLLREERTLYSAALDQFRIENVDRFLIGFKEPCQASELVHVYPEYVSEYWKMWNGEACPRDLIYGKCLQALSFHSLGSCREENEILAERSQNPNYATSTSVRPSKERRQIDVDFFSPRVVFQSEPETIPKAADHVIQSQLSPTSIIRPPTGTKIRNQSLPFLCDDPTAKALAIRYEADIVMTSTSFECLLQRAGCMATKWTLPLSSEQDLHGEQTNVLTLSEPRFSGTNSKATNKSKRIVFLEEPIPSMLTPRDCLTFGVNAALYEKVITLTREKLEHCTAFQSVYTILSIPHSGLHMKQITILVRSTNYLQDEQGHPLRIRAHLEYFPERGLEEYSAYERSIWLMEKILQADCRIFITRINPQDMTVIQTEEISSANALAVKVPNMFEGNCLNPVDQDITVNFNMFMELMNGVRTIATGRYLICFPGRDSSISLPRTTASLHGALKGTSNYNHSTASVTIDIEEELKVARTVSIAKSCLMSCYRLWRWECSNNRIPYTFRPT